MHTDVEQEEHHPEFGQQVGGGTLLDEGHPARSDDHPGDQVTDDGTQPQRAHEGNRQYADNEQNDHRLKRVDVFHPKFSL